MPRFFIEADQIVDKTVRIYGDDAKHIAYSLRMAKGEHITVCDKNEKEYECVLTSFENDSVTAEIIAEGETPGESPVRIHLYQGLPKGDKLDTVIQKAVECGVFDITPVESTYCIAKAKADNESRKTERRNRIAIEAAKQCGRGRIPVVYPTISFEQAVGQATQSDLALICYEDEVSTTVRQVLSAERMNGVSSISVLIGSEGGFSVEEIKRAKECGLRSISLGKRILRTETAPIFILSCISYEFEL